MMTNNARAPPLSPASSAIFSSCIGAGLSSRLAKKNNITPIEVKSGKKARFASLRKFTSRFGDFVEEPLLFHMKDVKESEGVKFLPLYMAACL